MLFDLTNGKLGQAGTVETEIPVSLPLLAMLRRSCRLVCAGTSGRGRDRTGARAISATTEWPTEWIDAPLLTRALCIIFLHCSFPCSIRGQYWFCNISWLLFAVMQCRFLCTIQARDSQRDRMCSTIISDYGLAWTGRTGYGGSRSAGHTVGRESVGQERPSVRWCLHHRPRGPCFSTIAFGPASASAPSTPLSTSLSLPFVKCSPPGPSLVVRGSQHQPPRCVLEFARRCGEH